MIQNENFKTFNTFYFYVFKFQDFKVEKNYRNHNAFILQIKKQSLKILNGMSKSLSHLRTDSKLEVVS